MDEPPSEIGCDGRLGRQGRFTFTGRELLRTERLLRQRQSGAQKNERLGGHGHGKDHYAVLSRGTDRRGIRCHRLRSARQGE